MITLEQLVEMLKDKNHAAIAKEAKMTRAYVNAIASGVRVNPSLDAVNRIVMAMEKLDV